jgi:hypothetical protein
MIYLFITKILPTNLLLTFNLIYFNHSQASMEVCNDTIQDTTLLSAMSYGALASTSNLVLSLTCGSKKRFGMMCILASSATAAILLNVVTIPIAGGIFFFFFLLCALSMGILSVYFVELYPTSLRYVANK